MLEWGLSTSPWRVVCILVTSLQCNLKVADWVKPLVVGCTLVAFNETQLLVFPLWYTVLQHWVQTDPVSLVATTNGTIANMVQVAVVLLLGVLTLWTGGHSLDWAVTRWSWRGALRCRICEWCPPGPYSPCLASKQLQSCERLEVRPVEAPPH